MANELTLTIHIAQRTYQPGEDIWLEATLRNNGAATLLVLPFLTLPANDPHKNTFSVRITDRSGKPITRTSNILTGRMLYVPEPVAILPGGYLQYTAPVAGTFDGKARWVAGELYDAGNEYTIVTPGSYSVSAVYEITEQHIYAPGAGEIWRGRASATPVEVVIG
ncbi:hypothetical protein ACFOTA_19650 [Chitinophaga sp. GCM10012297]|uniref:Uncharacterized protein n=1 Tax=Chitinophaga chungangae TaxID=2821488 RepID=A0ABS3YIA9_9BACT|nr:hypothetical protein [Chitinophaga chungangae]MBO9154437.1 hypothetical protein [Chitinophaga chungangae]